MLQFTFKDQIESFEDYMDTYLKNKSRDCILYSEDGSKIKVHKELFGQTQFLREILSCGNERCCGTIDIFCPCSKDELNHLVNFLYDGEIHCEEEFDSLKILENLNKIFGFSNNLAMQMPNDPISEVFPNLNVAEASGLKKHELIHTDEKLHSCRYCSKMFRDLGNMKKHELIHSGGKLLHAQETMEKFGNIF